MPVTNKCGPDLSWRLIYTATDVIQLFESIGITETKHNIFEASTKEECLAKIDELGLNYKDETVKTDVEVSQE